MKKIAAIIVVAAVGLSACGDDPRDVNEVKRADRAVQKASAKRKPYIPMRSVEFKNYNDAQKLYDSPNTVVWCTAFPSNPSAPIITTPIAGKLTSSSVSYLPPDKIVDVGTDAAVTVQNKSSDGMYHGSPPPYRYGFTPGGQYIDYSGMEVLCTTALTKFQRQKTFIETGSPDGSAAADSAAEDALKRGDRKAAQKAVESMAGERP